MTITADPVTHRLTGAPKASTAPAAELPRLRRGGGEPDPGCLCAMQELSLINGDEIITAFPMDADTLLALLVQEVNDRHCTHEVLDAREVCDECSTLIRALAARTRGTHTSDDDLTFTIYLAIASRLGIDADDLRRDHPHFVALELLERLPAQQITPATVHDVIDWWRDYIRVRTGRTVGTARTDEAAR